MDTVNCAVSNVQLLTFRRIYYRFIVVGIMELMFWLMMTSAATFE